MNNTYCCGRPFVISEIIRGETTPPTVETFYELREDGGIELREDGSNELREN